MSDSAITGKNRSALWSIPAELLTQIAPDELMSYLLLDRYPLYDYKNPKGDIELLCLGSGTFIKRFILSALSCGQMLDSRLMVHIVSDQEGDTVKKELLTRAPMLADYTDLTSAAPIQCCASFTYAREADLLKADACARIAGAYGQCRYVVISLGDGGQNRTMARRYAKEAAAHRPLVLYHDPAPKAREDIGLQTIPFDNGRAAFPHAARSLGERALRLSYLYDKLADPRAALEDTAKRFVRDVYGQRSSCASALHLKYKLASVGIRPVIGTNRSAVIAAYRKKLAGPERSRLIELEHRRWLMYMIADGYRLPNLDTVDSYSFRTGQGDFNASFKDTANKYHPCMVPSSGQAPRLPKDRDAWDRYKTLAEIEATPFDPLDQMSLKLHWLAGRRICSPGVKKELQDDLANGIGALLAAAFSRWRDPMQAGAEKPDGIDLCAETLQEQYAALQKTLGTLLRTDHFTDEVTAELALLEQTAARFGIDVAAGCRKVTEDLQIFVEFARYRDYKAADATIVDHLPWLLYAGEAWTLVKLRGRTVSDAITAPLLLMPVQTVYFGSGYDQRLVTFLQAHGLRGSVTFKECAAQNIRETCRALAVLRRSIPGRCVFDVTGSDELLVAAAVRLAAEHRQTAVIRCSAQTQQVENIMGFPSAGAYQLNTTISAEEVYELYGAHGEPADRYYMLRMERFAPTLWNFYNESRQVWAALCAFFNSKGSRAGELFLKYNASDRKRLQWKDFAVSIDSHNFTSLNIRNCLEAIEKEGFLRDLAVDNMPGGKYLSFQYAAIPQDDQRDPIRSAYGIFFSFAMWRALAPFTTEITHRSDGGTGIAVRSGSYFSISGKEHLDENKPLYEDLRPGAGSMYAFSTVIPSLRQMEKLKLIRDLNIKTATASVRFYYSDLAVPDVLAKDGNVLELYTWYAAQRTGYFDDCRPNLTFTWHQDSVKNELDLILTKGLQTLVVSCKMSKYNKEHLYEIRSLTDQFSLNSKAVIVYSSMQAVEDGHLVDDLSYVKNRAAAMGVYLIDLNKLPSPDQLAQRLIEIAEA